MWSFTDCLVMVGGWDTATGQTGGGQGCRDLPRGRRKLRALGATQTSRRWTVPRSLQERGVPVTD